LQCTLQGQHPHHQSLVSPDFPLSQRFIDRLTGEAAAVITAGEENLDRRRPDALAVAEV
jgi:hypothetical protein